ncbi:MAG: ABC transporter substrate-binding protein [Nocardioidaceae bacterium]
MTSSRSSRTRLLVLGLVVGALAIAGCTDSGGGSAKGDSKTLVVALEDVTTGFDPDGPNSATQSAIESIGNAFGTLLTYSLKDEDGVLYPDYTDFQPAMATSWESSEDGKTWTIKLRDDIKSCAGNPLTAEDIVWTWGRMKSVTGTNAIGWFFGNVGGVFNADAVAEGATDADKTLTEVTAVDEHTVQFKLQAPNALFPRVLTIPFLATFDSTELKKHVTDADPWAHDYTQKVGPAGFGPYCVSQWDSGNSLTWEANPGWYEQPYFTKVIETKVPSDANRVASLVNGQVQATQGLTPNQYKELGSNDKVDVLGYTGTDDLYFMPNFDIEPWVGDKGRLLRQAVAYALPYDEIIDQIYYGSAERKNSVIASGYAGIVEETPYDTDLEKSKELLAQAGYPDGKGLEQYAKGLVLNYDSERKGTLEPIAILIQTALAKVGIPITLEPITEAEYGSRSITTKDVPIYMMNNARALIPDAGYAMQVFYVSAAKGGIVNANNYANDTVDSLYAESAQLPDGEERNALLKEIQDILWDDLPWIPIALPQTQFAVADGIKGVVSTPDSQFKYAYLTR